MMDVDMRRIYPSFRYCVERLIEQKMGAERERTAGNYRSTWNKFVSFKGNKAKELVITDMTAGLVQEFVMWLLRDEKTGNNELSPGSQDFYLRNLKAMYNSIARDLHYRNPDGSPFEGLHIPVPPTRKRALPLRDLRKLMGFKKLENPEHVAALQLSLFLFYARGMCFVDAYKLQYDHVTNGYIHYTRSKTQVDLQVKITPEMHQIMQRYYVRGSRWVFPFLHEKMIGKGAITAQSALHRVNGHLKEIGDELRLPYPLTTYVMRHSWASLMLEAGSEIGIISQSLGHTSLQTTEIYLGQLSKSKMDKASDIMLDNLIRAEPKGKTNTNGRKRRTPEDSDPIVPPAPQKKPSFMSKCKSAFYTLVDRLYYS